VSATTDVHRELLRIARRVADGAPPMAESS
jgi:hypothetical protein